MTIPSPPSDFSGGYLITTYTNGSDKHSMRLHVRAFDATGAYLTPGAGTPTTLQADWTAFMAKVAAHYNSAWNFNLTALFQNNGDGTFTELFGWTAPAQLPGTNAAATPNDQTRAGEMIYNFKDGHGGRGRVILIGQPGNSMISTPVTLGGVAGGTVAQQLVDQITAPTKTNIVSHAGHQFQSPAHITFAVNRRLRRHYGFS